MIRWLFKKFRLLLILALLSSVFWLPLLVAQSESKSEIIDEVITEEVVNDDFNYYTSRAVMKLIIVYENDQGEKVNATGSAIIIHEDDDYSYLVTNHHNIRHQDYDLKTIVAVDYTNATYEAISMIENDTYEIISDLYDLALLRTRKLSIKPAVISTLEMQPGSVVHSVGYPKGERAIEQGVFIEMINDLEYFPFEAIKSNATIQKGSSGGALIDRKGNLIGMTTLGAFASGNEFVYSYSIPVSIIQEYLQLYF